MMFNDVLLIPDLFAWITGRYAEELSKALKPYRTLTCPTWFLRRHPRVFRGLARHSRMIVNIDPWFAQDVMRQCRGLPQQRPVACVLHHVNDDDPNAAFIAQADLSIATCEAAQEYLATLVQSPRQVLLVEIGVDTEEFRPLDKTKCRRLLGIDEKGFLVGYVGKVSSDFHGRKGLDTLQQIVSAFASEPNIEFAFCGGGLAEWRKRFGGGKGRLRHFGFIDRERLCVFYNALDVLLMTSRNEGGPAGILEAMACGVPTVASRTGLVPKLVATGINGYSLDPKDVSGFIEAIRRLAADRDLCTLLGKRARITVAEAWGWQIKLAPFAKAIKRTLATEDHSPPHRDLARLLRVLCETCIRKCERIPSR
jgi:glycosyltransferase involved in cell wall biosynthesis